MPKTNDWTIYHNSRCSKSRSALALLEEKGIAPKIVDYLKAPLSEAELKALLGQLGLKARDIVRSKEPKFAELKLGLEDEAALIKAMSRHPELLERPIVVRGEKAVLGRPPENVLRLF